MKRFAIIAGGLVAAAALTYWLGLGSGTPAMRASLHPAGAKDIAAVQADTPVATAPKPATTGPQSGGVKQTETATRFAAIPPGPFRQSLENLTPAIRQRALLKLAKLNPPKEDYASLRASPDGALFYVCVLPAPPQGPSAAAKVSTTGTSTQSAAAVSGPSVPISSPPVLHSRPGSANVLYLDFNGETITGTRWNSTYGITTWVALPYDTDGDPTTFSATEQAAIEQIWERVAEDYSPFDIDVTTEQPAVFTPTTGRALITAATDANGVTLPNAEAAGGVAFVDVFGDYDYATSGSPALIYYTSFVNNTAALAEAVSHELGHNLGLSHQGQTNGNEYYTGNGTGDTSWGPIMGAPYGRNVTQWAEGDYYLANNKEDAVGIIAAHTAFRPPSAGSTLTTAVAAPTTGSALLATGVLTRATSPVVYSFNTTKATISLAVTTYRAASGTNGGDADVKLELLNSGGVVVATSAPPNSTNASLTYKASAGTYYARLTPDGTGNPFSSNPIGYTNYGSLGQYTFTGTIGAAAPAITSATTASTGGAQSFLYQIIATGSPTSYTATGLPAGLSVDTTSGLISGRVMTAGVYAIQLSATNALGTGTATLTLTVTPAAPSIISQTSGLLVAAPGGALTLNVSALSASGTVTYAWVHGGVVIPGATGSALTLSGLTTADSGFYQVLATNSAGTTTGALQFVRVAPATTQVVAWDNGISGLTGVPADLTNAVAVAAGYSHALAVTRDGSVRGWGSNAVGETTIPAGLANAVAVAAGYYDSLALKADGTVTAWGYNTSGQTTVPAGLANVIAIAGGDAHFLALIQDGTVVAWGDNTYGQTTVPAGLANVVAIAAGRNHSLALKSDGTVVAWGDSSQGLSQIPAGLANVVAIAAGSYHSMALKADGTVTVWGYSLIGPIPSGNGSVTEIAAGYYHSLAELADNTVVAWGDSGSGETVVPTGLNNVFAIAGGNGSSFAVRDATAATTVAPVITLQPLDENVNAGASASFAVTATGTPAPSFQWQVSTDGGATWAGLSDGGAYAGTATTSLSIAAATVALSGYQFHCVATNPAGSATSNAATLTVIPPNTPPTISAIADQTTAAGTATAALAFTVGDAETPAAALTVSAASSNPALVPAANIVFGGSGASRTVTVTPAASQSGSATITLTVSDGSLTTSTAFNLTVLPPNTPPTISTIASQSVNENTASAPLAFTVGDQETAATALTVSASSSNPALVPAANLVLGGTGTARTITVTPASNATGSTTITLTVSDGSLSTSSTFTLTVVPVNTPPTISGIADQNIATNGSTGALAFTVGDAETAATSLTVSRSSSNTTLVPTANIVLGGSGASRTVTVTPAANRTGTAVITLTVSDGALTAATTFTVTVATPNTPPTISSIANQTISENTSTGSLAFTVSDAQTPASNLVVTTASSNLALVPNASIVLGGSSSHRTIAVTPAANQAGTATITVTVSDGQLSTSTSFLLTVNLASSSTGRVRGVKGKP